MHATTRQRRNKKRHKRVVNATRLARWRNPLIYDGFNDYTSRLYDYKRGSLYCRRRDVRIWLGCNL